jgi:hypothetical protein
VVLHEQCSSHTHFWRSFCRFGARGTHFPKRPTLLPKWPMIHPRLRSALALICSRASGPQTTCGLRLDARGSPVLQPLAAQPGPPETGPPGAAPHEASIPAARQSGTAVRVSSTEMAIFMAMTCGEIRVESSGMSHTGRNPGTVIVVRPPPDGLMVFVRSFCWACGLGVSRSDQLPIDSPTFRSDFAALGLSKGAGGGEPKLW